MALIRPFRLPPSLLLSAMMRPKRTHLHPFWSKFNILWAGRGRSLVTNLTGKVPKLLAFTNSPVILWKKIGQPATNCNRRFFNGFRLCNVSLLTYQKSQKIPLREVTKKRDLLWSSETRFMSPWERGWPKLFFYKAREKIFNLVKCNEISSLHVQF